MVDKLQYHYLPKQMECGAKHWKRRSYPRWSWHIHKKHDKGV